MEALHQVDPLIRPVASVCRGSPSLGIGDHIVGTATVESDLSLLGPAEPAASVYLRTLAGRARADATKQHALGRSERDRSTSLQDGRQAVTPSAIAELDEKQKQKYASARKSTDQAS